MSILDLEWSQIVVSLLGGGAMGAIINSGVTSFRNKIQPVGWRCEVLPIFIQTLGESSLHAKVTISEDNKVVNQFNNLFLIEVQVVNRGNTDLNEFNFGITLSEGEKAVYVETKSNDRHHLIEQTTLVTPTEPKNEIDFILKPFNRRDSYVCKLFVVIPEGQEKPGEIRPSSPQPIKFTDMPTMAELLTQAAGTSSLMLGPISLSLRVQPPFIKTKK